MREGCLEGRWAVSSCAADCRLCVSRTAQAAALSAQASGVRRRCAASGACSLNVVAELLRRQSNASTATTCRLIFVGDSVLRQAADAARCALSQTHARKTAVEWRDAKQGMHGPPLSPTPCMLVLYNEGLHYGGFDRTASAHSAIQRQFTASVHENIRWLSQQAPGRLLISEMTAQHFSSYDGRFEHLSPPAPFGRGCSMKDGARIDGFCSASTLVIGMQRYNRTSSLPGYLRNMQLYLCDSATHTGCGSMVDRLGSATCSDLDRQHHDWRNAVLEYAARRSGVPLVRFHALTSAWGAWLHAKTDEVGGANKAYDCTHMGCHLPEVWAPLWDQMAQALQHGPNESKWERRWDEAPTSGSPATWPVRPY